MTGLIPLGIIFLISSWMDDNKWLIGIGISLILVGLIPIDTELTLTESTPIYALQDNQTISGGTFYVSQNFKYYYMTDGENGKQMKSIDAENTYIKEDSSVQPCLQTLSYVPVSKNKILRFLSLDAEIHRIVVPESTVTDKFNIDMN